ncbi:MULTISPECIES: alpha/beta hydrolase [unclassified Nocardia]|uniref:alpha/beta hydrolase n=1 Tax=unclassified Nocardia TaxID=2637762 RepID=UPI001CE41DA0|nr:MULTISPECIES: alpha/beta hydrolase [unclassified Nocardia]
MTTIGHVRACDPHTMLTFAEHLGTQCNTFTDRVDRMATDVNKEMDSWKGAGAWAASARTLAHKLDGNHLAETVIAIADHYNDFGTELAGQRDALLKIVDQAQTADGMQVDDAGKVTAPTVPPGNEHPSLPGMVQHHLDTQAADYQSRIQQLLTQFGDTETKAAQAITDALQLLDTYEKHPDAPNSSKVQDIIDGKAQLPDEPKQLHDFWETLTPAEKDALWQHDHYIGNRDGIPVVDRDHFNRMTLRDELARARAGDPAVKDRLADLEKLTELTDGKPDHYLMLLDTKSGAIPHAALALGNPDLADHVATFVPGTGSQPFKGMDWDRIQAMRDQAKTAGAQNPSVISWFGYDAPSEIPKASDLSYANAGYAALDRFQDGLRASHIGAPSYNTVVGYSYGSTVVGAAASHGHSLNADAVAFVASPGTTVDHASDLRLTGVRAEDVPNHVYATKAIHDPVPEYGSNRLGRLFKTIFNADPANSDPLRPRVVPSVDDFGPDPTDSDFHGRTFQSDPGSTSEMGLNGSAHGEYWNHDPKHVNRALEGMGDIIAGQGDKATQIPAAPPEVAQTQEVPPPPPTGGH